MTNDYFESIIPIEIDLGGVKHEGRFRVTNHVVVVYYEHEVKFADCGPDHPELVARRLLLELCCRVRGNGQKPRSTG